MHCTIQIIFFYKLFSGNPYQIRWQSVHSSVPRVQSHHPERAVSRRWHLCLQSATYPGARRHRGRFRGNFLFIRHRGSQSGQIKYHQLRARWPGGRSGRVGSPRGPGARHYRPLRAPGRPQMTSRQAPSPVIRRAPISRDHPH